MIITYTFTIARWQIVVKRSEATKQTKDLNNNRNKQTNKYSFIVIISSTNKYRKHKSNVFIWVLPMDKMIITQTFMMSNFCQKIWGKNKNKPKTKTATKQILKQNNKKQKNGKGNIILQVLFHRLFGEIHLNFILHILFYMTVQNRSWRSNFLDLHASFSTLFTSSTPVCLSGLLHMYSSSRSLHPSGGTCPQPLPSCMCTGGVVRSFTSRLGQPLVWAHRHSTAVMYHLSASFFSIFSKLIYLKLFYSA